MREMGFQVTFIPEDNFLYMPEYTTGLQRVGIEVLYAPYVTSVKQHVKDYGDRYDLVFISRPVTFERNIKLVREYCRKAKVIFHTVDLHFLRMQREADLLKSVEAKAKAAEMRDREFAHMKAADISTVLSIEEISIVKKHLPNCNVRLLPYSRKIQGTKKTFEERKNIIFVGGFQHAPNIDAAKYFVNAVMPFLRKKLPDVIFYIVA